MKNNVITTELNVVNNKVSVIRVGNIDYISLTDLAKYKDKDRTYYIIQNWMRNTNSILFLGTWEILNNINFNSIEFDGFKNNLENTNAELIELNINQRERLIKLNASAKRQMKILSNNKSVKELEILQNQVNNN